MTGNTAARETTSEWTLWVVAVSCALHVAEEYFTGWQAWARPTLGIVMPTSRFIAMNVLLVVAALILARVGWRRPALSLVIPSATLVNAIVFHILPTIVQRRVAPGLYTAALLYVPFSSWALIGALRDRVPRQAIATAAAAGTLLMFGVVLAARLLSPIATVAREGLWLARSADRGGTWTHWRVAESRGVLYYPYLIARSGSVSPGGGSRRADASAQVV